MASSIDDTASTTSSWTTSTNTTLKPSRTSPDNKSVASSKSIHLRFESLYQNASIFRVHVMSALSVKGTKSQIEEPAARSREIDRLLEEDFLKKKRVLRVILDGDHYLSHTIFKQMKIFQQDELPMEERRCYRDKVRKKVFDDMCLCINRFLNLDSGDLVEDDAIVDARKILQYEEVVGPIHEFPQELANAIENLWRLKGDSFIERRNELYDDLVPLFYEEIRRIARLNYMPTNNDILLVGDRSFGIREVDFNIGRLAIHAIHLRLGCNLRKWRHIYDDKVTGIIYPIDLTRYDQIMPGCDTVDRQDYVLLREDFILLQSVVNSTRFFAGSPIILLLCNIAQFKARLERRPFKNYFKDYSGENDAQHTTEYILHLIDQDNRSKRRIYPHLVEVTEEIDMQLISTTLGDIMSRNSLEEQDDLF